MQPLLLFIMMERRSNNADTDNIKGQRKRIQSHIRLVARFEWNRLAVNENETAIWDSRKECERCRSVFFIF